MAPETPAAAAKRGTQRARAAAKSASRQGAERAGEARKAATRTTRQAGEKTGTALSEVGRAVPAAPPSRAPAIIGAGVAGLAAGGLAWRRRRRRRRSAEPDGGPAAER